MGCKNKSTVLASEGQVQGENLFLTLTLQDGNAGTPLSGACLSLGDLFGSGGGL